MTREEKQKDLEAVRQELLERGDELVSFRQLVERFDEVEEVFKGEPWNLEQIYTNFNILIGKELCEDVISRKAVMDTLGGWIVSGEYQYTNATDYLVKRVKALPSVPPVMPAEKTGHWILAGSQDYVDVENGNNRYICSECTFSDIHAKSSKVPYCWHCGARMESEI